MNGKAFIEQLKNPTPTKLRLANNLYVHKLLHVFIEFAMPTSTWERTYFDASLCNNLHPIWKSEITWRRHQGHHEREEQQNIVGYYQFCTGMCPAHGYVKGYVHGFVILEQHGM